MAEAKLAPKMQEWQIEHTNLYLSSGGKEGHVMKRTPPGGYPEMDTYSLLLTTTGRKSGEKFIFPLFYGEDKGKVLQGIYELDKDTLRWCTSAPGGKERPGEFSTKAGSKIWLFTLEKEMK